MEWDTHSLTMAKKMTISQEKYDEMEKKYTQELESVVKKAELATKTKDKFLANISHEIRTPMNAIIGLTHVLLENPLDKRQFDYLTKINNSANLLLGIINDILDFSKIEAGKIEVEYIPFNLNTTLENVSDMLSLKAEEKGLEFIFDIDNSVPSMIKGDPLRLGQVLINLISNAIKFTDKGEIILKITMPPSSHQQHLLEFEVCDTGIGLTSEQIDRLFEAFSQAQSDTSRKYGGTGLGLSISKELITLMGGTIRVASEYGKGSKFIFTILTEQLERRNYRLPSRTLMRKNVLIVEPNPKTSDALMQMLKYFQYTALYASSVEEAKPLIFENSFDIVFMDKSVLSLCESPKIKESCDAKLVVMESGLKMRNERMFNGVVIDGQLAKPFNQQMIFNVIVELFSQKSMPILKHSLPITKNDLVIFSGSTVLVAEDDVVNQTVIFGLLEDTGIKVIIANNGKEALDKLESYDEIEMIFMDINMPVIDGYEATSYIRSQANYESIPIIALTANTSQRDMQTAREMGMQGHLSKPIDVQMLYGLLLEYLRPKTVETSQNRVKKSQEKEKIEIPLELQALRFVNVEEGIERVGGKSESYKNVLLRFADIFKNSVENLEALLRLDKEKALALIHNIKGTSGNIGAKKIYEVMRLFEKSVKNEEKNDVLDHLLAEYASLLSPLLEEVERLRQPIEVKGESKPMLDKILLYTLLTQIHQEAKKRRPLTCKELSLELQSYRWTKEYSARLSQIVEGLKHYQFKNVMKMIEEIL